MKATSPENAQRKDLKETKEVCFLIYSERAPRDPPKCYNCQGSGHLARECPSERQERQERSYRPRNNEGNKCYNCGNTGHFARECTKEPRERENRENRGENRGQNDRECYNCKKVGHISRDCPEGGDRKRNIECHKCHENGHFARDCKSTFFSYFRLIQ